MGNRKYPSIFEANILKTSPTPANKATEGKASPLFQYFWHKSCLIRKFGLSLAISLGLLTEKPFLTKSINPGRSGYPGGGKIVAGRFFREALKGFAPSLEEFFLCREEGAICRSIGGGRGRRADTAGPSGEYGWPCRHGDNLFLLFSGMSEYRRAEVWGEWLAFFSPP
jgi:hypothetical protein